MGKYAALSISLASLAPLADIPETGGVLSQGRQQHRHARLPASNLNKANNVKTARGFTRARKLRHGPMAVLLR